jgi:competence protein ComGC
MKKGFTVIEVSILFVIFIIVAFLVVPLSMDDTIQAKNTARWRSVQQEFSNIFYSVETSIDKTSLPFIDNFNSTIDNQTKNIIEPYKIKFLNGSTPDDKYIFDNYKLTYSNAVIATKFIDKNNDNLKGALMYDVNGKNGPNIWGKDVFGFYIYQHSLEPFGADKSITEQKQDCSQNGTGLSCSNYYLIGGNFD